MQYKCDYNVVKMKVTDVYIWHSGIIGHVICKPVQTTDTTTTTATSLILISGNIRSDPSNLVSWQQTQYTDFMVNGHS